MNQIKTAVSNHPNLTAWLVLALGMNILLIFEARNVGLETSQWFWLIIITTLVAGTAIWIISWGDDEDEAVESETG